MEPRELCCLLTASCHLTAILFASMTSAACTRGCAASLSSPWDNSLVLSRNAARDLENASCACVERAPTRTRALCARSPGRKVWSTTLPRVIRLHSARSSPVGFCVVHEQSHRGCCLRPRAATASTCWNVAHSHALLLRGSRRVVLRRASTPPCESRAVASHCCNSSTSKLGLPRAAGEVQELWLHCVAIACLVRTRRQLVFTNHGDSSAESCTQCHSPPSSRCHVLSCTI